MFNAKLYDFQKIHEENLLKACANHKELVLSAPTGSGKTVLVCKFIDDYLDEHPTLYFFGYVPEQEVYISSRKKVFPKTRLVYPMEMFMLLLESLVPKGMFFS